ncbi:F-box protein [Quillaja saponaria]|uniref:F-box protein n=1 Tax=Quillaja saponaria TaxID=32244 RepID=A0AAD7LN09_QUISA|nr:F-box protein [Quillaja saponaria]
MLSIRLGGSDNDVLVAFDLGTEQCRELPHPEPNNPFKTLSVLGGCLSVTILHYKGYEDCCIYSAHVWVMKIYGIEDSWTKVCKVSHLPLSRSVYVKPLAYSRCRDKILLYFDDGDGLVWYDLKMKRTQNVKVSGAPRFYVTTFVVGSLVPLNNSVTD